MSFFFARQAYCAKKNKPWKSVARGLIAIVYVERYDVRLSLTCLYLCLLLKTPPDPPPPPHAV